MRSPQPDWTGVDRTAAAADRIVEVAGELFCDRGATAVSMGEIAAAVGCSRATLYRYYRNRTDLQLAYVERMARIVGTTVAAKTEGIADPADRLTESVMIAVAEVRANPALAAWFGPAEAANSGRLALTSDTIADLARSLLADGDPAAATDAGQTQWIVRIILSLLTIPGDSVDDERAMVARFLTPIPSAPG
ncbi:TetR/AcrR family transcriptional regulator [Jongsikchunia kroppenstedtii]|uniref:TetR/AcrR family transcriptional regulator n=1 Tax=Jongsikchunia kroppenstedtii TaxID=1121721 RepID=UPI000380D0BA|nr:TetR/AcrR family transcriptional regulator [Jongsikchunia kroppenstedtii]